MFAAGRFHFVLAALGSAALAVPAASESPPRSRRAVLEYARAHAPRVEARIAERDRIRGEARARGFFLPSAPSVGGEWADRGSEGSERHDRVLDARLTLEPFGQGIFRARAAGAVERQELAAVDAAARGWAAEVAWRHQERLRQLWLQSRSSLQADVTQRLADVVQRRFEAGDASGLEVDLARVEAAEGSRRRFESERSVSAIEAGLAAAIGWPIETPLPAPDSLELVPAFPDTAALVAHALLARPELRIARAAVEAGNRQAQLANAHLLPEAELSVFGGQEDGEDIRGVRVGASLPFLGPEVFERGRDAAFARRARAELRAAEIEARAEITAVRVAAGLAHQQVALYIDRILPGIDGARQRYEEAYGIGQVDLTTVLLTEQRYRDAERAFAEALGVYIDALRDLEIATGIPVLSGYETAAEGTP